MYFSGGLDIATQSGLHPLVAARPASVPNLQYFGLTFCAAPLRHFSNCLFVQGAVPKHFPRVKQQHQQADLC